MICLLSTRAFTLLGGAGNGLPSSWPEMIQPSYQVKGSVESVRTHHLSLCWEQGMSAVSAASLNYVEAVVVCKSTTLTPITSATACDILMCSASPGPGLGTDNVDCEYRFLAFLCLLSAYKSEIENQIATTHAYTPPLSDTCVSFSVSVYRGTVTRTQPVVQD